MTYALTTGRIVWSLHDTQAQAIRALKQEAKRWPEYRFEVRGLTGGPWTKGDCPSVKCWVYLKTGG